MAKAAGAEVIPGIEMFVQQAARQFEIWTGKPAPLGEMLLVVNRVIEERAAQKNSNQDSRKK
jgi:3-dehydroquinate dehydratase/shikimate dehydrogenase